MSQEYKWPDPRRFNTPHYYRKGQWVDCDDLGAVRWKVPKRGWYVVVPVGYGNAQVLCWPPQGVLAVLRQWVGKR